MSALTRESGARRRQDQARLRWSGPRLHGENALACSTNQQDSQQNNDDDHDQKAVNNGFEVRTFGPVFVDGVGGQIRIRHAGLDAALPGRDNRQYGWFASSVARGGGGGRIVTVAGAGTTRAENKKRSNPEDDDRHNDDEQGGAALGIMRRALRSGHGLWMRHPPARSRVCVVGQRRGRVKVSAEVRRGVR